MKYEIRLTTQAKRTFTHLDKKIKDRIIHVLEQFESGNFNHHNIKSLKGPLQGSMRYRLGDWRIIFRVNHEDQIVIIESITTRGGAYR